MQKLRKVKFIVEDACYDEMQSPVGTLTLIASTQGLHAVLWDVDRNNPHGEKMMHSLSPSVNNKTIESAKKQLSEYFERKRKTFALPLAMHGTPFQKQVWEQLLTIPYSTSMTYAEQAQKIGNKNKARAVGAANGLNPISIIIPCHRVIGSNGRLVGFGGGLERKAYLLRLEQNA